MAYFDITHTAPQPSRCLPPTSLSNISSPAKERNNDGRNNGNNGANVFEDKTRAASAANQVDAPSSR